MADAWRWSRGGGRDRSPLHSGADRGDHGERSRPADRYLRVGVSHPSGDPTLHRVFEVRAYYAEEDEGWVAQVGELNLNDQPTWGPEARERGRVRAFPTPAACLGDAIAVLVARVDREDANQT